MIVPVEDALTRTAAAIAANVRTFAHAGSLASENAALQRKVQELAASNERLKEHAAENIRLRRMLALAQDMPVQTIAATVVGYAPEGTRRAITIDRGWRDGVSRDAVVVDGDGETIVVMRGDNAAPHTVENARRKAYTAMTFKQTTADYAKKLNDGNPVVRQQVTLPNVIAIPGGVPIKVGDEVVGGVGASGSPGFDDDCVAAGLNAVKDQLQ